MGVPREAVRLVGKPSSQRLLGRTSGKDWTAAMQAWAQTRVRELADAGLCGFIFKKDSPSSGLERVKVYTAAGMPSGNGPGMFARVVLDQFPHLPVEDEGRLNDPVLRENFIERVFAFHRLQQLQRSKFSRQAVVLFHSQHKLLLLSHSPKHYQELGRLVARVGKPEPKAWLEAYGRSFMEGMQVKTTRGKHVNVLEHVFGYLKDILTPAQKQDVLQTIKDYGRNLVPLIVPITLLNHYVRTLEVPYIREQLYLNPHPKELMLRNRV